MKKKILSLDKINKAFFKILKENNIKNNPLLFKQQNALNSILIKGHDAFMAQNSFFIPSSTLSAAFPFNNSYLLDEKGMYLGKNTSGGLMFWDQFLISNYRTNHNVLILGRSGMGKTYLTTKILNHHILTGKKVIIIDFERDYEKLCNFYNGNLIDVSKKEKLIINPLQVLITEEDTNHINNHLFFLEEFFKIIAPDFNNEEIRLLIRLIIGLYQKRSTPITEENIHLLKPKDFPTFDELQDFVSLQITWNLQKKVVNQVQLEKINNFLKLELINTGLYGSIFNGITNINLNSNLTLFEFANLKKVNKKLLFSLEFLILNYINNIVHQNSVKKETNVVICIDEAHLMINHQNLVALDFIHEMYKRIRKKGGGMIITTQQPDDFIATEEIRAKTMAIINNCQYFFILPLSAKNIQDVDGLFSAYGGLSANEVDYLSRAKRGEAFFINSNYDRYFIDITATEADLKVIEFHKKGGG